MERDLKKKIRAFLRARRYRGQRRRLLTAMASIVVFCTTYALILPAITMACDREEHTHTAACYLWSDYAIQEDAPHEHTAECYGADGLYACGYADFYLHSHGSLCYAPNGDLACPLPEVEAHTHDETCLEEIDGVMQLTCGKEELHAHEHTAECYEEDEDGNEVLACGETELLEHTHDAACVANAGGEITICGKEAHTHGVGCVVAVATDEVAYLTDDSSGTNFAVRVTVTPQVESVGVGQTGAFNLIIEAADSSGASAETTVKVHLNADWLSALQTSSFPEGLMLVEEGDDAPYLQYTVTGTGTTTIPISFHYPNGITLPQDITILDSDITVETNIEGNQVKQGGTLHFTAAFGWDPVTKTQTAPANNLTIDENRHLSSDVTYAIGATSKNGGSSGVVFTKSMTLTDTLTLPEDFSFVGTGEDGSVRTTGTGWTITRSGQAIMQLTDSFSGSNITKTIESVTFDDTNRTMTITYTCAYTGEAENYAVEMPNLSLAATLNREAVQLAADAPMPDGKNTILQNEVDFTAEPFVQNETITTVTSSAEVEIPIFRPDPVWSIDKQGTVLLAEENGTAQMQIRYTITVRNDSMFPLENVTITDALPRGETLLTASDVPDSFANRVLTWNNQTIPANGSVTKQITVAVDSGVPAGTSLTNTAAATYENDTKRDSVTHTVIQPEPNPQISKTNNKVSAGGQTYPEETLTYTIHASNNGLKEIALYIKDVMPAGLENPRNFQWSTDGGRTWMDYTDGEVKIEGQTLTFPAKTLDRLESTENIPSDWYVRYNATVSKDVEQGVTLTNTATLYEAGTNEKKDESSSTVTTRQRAPKLTLQKEAGDVVDRGTDWYTIPYTLTIGSVGDEILAGDTVTVSDVMSGGLMPEAGTDATSGTVTAVWRQGTTTQDLVGHWTRSDTPDGDGNYTYTIKWTMPPMPSGTETNPVNGTITYNGFIKVTDPQGNVITTNARNQASLSDYPAGGQGGTTTELKPEPSVDKVILTGNSTTKSSRISSGAVVTYRLTLRNTGTAAIMADVTDALPEPYGNFGFAWELGKNVEITQNFSGVDAPTLETGTRTLDWEPIRLGVNQTLTCDVRLTYPSGTMFANAFEPESGTRTLTNTVTMVTPDPDNPRGDPLTQTASATHTVRATDLRITKTASPNTLLTTGGNVTFTIGGFGTSTGVGGMRVTDTLTGVTDGLSLKRIETGSFTITNPAGGTVASYTLTLTDASGSHEITVPTSGTTITAADVQGVDFDRLISIDWNFGDVGRLTIGTAPQLDMTVRDTQATSVQRYTNNVHLSYNGKDATASADVRALCGIALNKTATKGGEPLDNEDNQAKSGDSVRFEISYTNISGEPVTLTADNALTDLLTCKGIRAGSYPVYAYIGNTQTNITPATLNITEGDIANATAKETEFTGVTVPAGQTLRITYSVTMSSEFINSQGEYSKSAHADWDNNGTPNLHILHNRVQAPYEGDTLTAQTDYYYQKGEDKLIFQKSVLGVSTITGDWLNIGGRDYASLNYGADEARDLNSLGETAYKVESKRRPAAGTSANVATYDMVKYLIIVGNDSNSTRSVTIQSIRDQLPEGTLLGSAGAATAYPEISTAVQLGGFYTRDNPNAKANLLAGNASDDPAGNRTTRLRDQLNRMNSTADRRIYFYAPVTTTDIQSVIDIPAGMTAKAASISIDGYPSGTGWGSSNPIFRMRADLPEVHATDVSDSRITLQPGEIIAFAYGVVLDRSNGDPSVWTNTATLTTNEDFAVSDEGVTVKGVGTTHNDAVGERTAAHTYEASVSIYPPVSRIGVAKTAVAKIEQATERTLTGILGQTENPDVSSLTFSDVVRWDVTMRNDGDSTVRNATLTERIPAPYKVLTDASTTTYVGVDADGKKIAGRVETTENSAGEEEQTVTITGVTIPTGESVTYSFYTYYDSAEQRSYNYTNRAELTMGGTVQVSDGSPVYDENRTKIIGVAAEASVFPTASAGTVSAKRVSDGTNTASGGSSDNTLTVSELGSTVRYTLSIENANVEEGQYQDFVLIDRLPAVGDHGVVNASATRGSEFAVRLAETPNWTVEIKRANGTTVPLQAASSAAETSGFYVAYSDSDSQGGFSTEWTDGFTGTDIAPQDATAFSLRLLENITLQQGESLEISYDAVVPNTAAAGQTAWNSFGFSFIPDENNTRVYTEPARVGVTVTETSLIIQKVSGEAGSQAPLAGAEFALYRDADCTQEISRGTSVMNDDHSAATLTLTGMLYNGTYWLKETAAPDGYAILTEPMQVTVNEGRIEIEGYAVTYENGVNTVTISNAPHRLLPETGGGGTLPYTLAGGALLALSALMLRYKRHGKGGMHP